MMIISSLYQNVTREHSTKLLHSYFLTIPTLCERQGFITSISMKVQLVVLYS
jgi:hypothetical protein